MARWLSLAWQDVQNNVSYTAALKEKYCLNWEGFLAVTTPSALESASPSCEEAPESILILFPFLCLPLQADIWRCRKVTAYRRIQTPEELQPLGSRSHAYVLQYGWKVTKTDSYGVHDTNLKMFCLQYQTLGLARSSRPSCRTWWLQGACSPLERSSERVGASHLYLL